MRVFRTFCFFLAIVFLLVSCVTTSRIGGTSDSSGYTVNLGDGVLEDSLSNNNGANSAMGHAGGGSENLKFPTTARKETLRLSNSDMLAFANYSAKEEFDNQRSGIVMWNNSESFLSLGIGHYLWGRSSKYGESFREMMKFAHDSGCYQGQPPAPSILHYNPRNGQIGSMPFASRPQFRASSGNAQVVELKKFLWNDNMRICQVKFQLNRLGLALQQMMKHKSHNQQFVNYLKKLISTPGGLYAMLDYVNFKGEGGKWGLYPVLARASYDDKNSKPMNSFIAAAKNVLFARRGMRQYYAGWNNRLNTYNQLGGMMTGQGLFNDPGSMLTFN